MEVIDIMREQRNRAMDAEAQAVSAASKAGKAADAAFAKLWRLCEEGKVPLVDLTSDLPGFEAWMQARGLSEGKAGGSTDSSGNPAGSRNGTPHRRRGPLPSEQHDPSPQAE